MRWDGGGDDDADGGDDVHDDPDDARRDGDDDDDDPSSGREIPRQISPCWSSSSLCLVSASWRRRKNTSSIPPTFLGQGSIIRRRGDGEGPQGPGAGPCRGPRGARGRGSHLPPVARLFAPFCFRDLFP